MLEFFHALADPANAFLRHALATAVLASIAAGCIGSFVVVRRITYVAGGIAHCVFGGLGAAYYLNRVHGVQLYVPFSGWQPLHPLYGAVAAAIAAAIIIGIVSLKARQREDTVISAVWAIGMAVGVLFVYLTPGYGQDLMSYLFGSILMVSRGELVFLAVLDAIVVGIALLSYKQFLAVCFDEEFARLRGVRVEFYYLLLLSLTALTTVLLVSVVGIIMVIALLSLPVAIAGHFTHSLGRLMVLSAALSTLLTTTGLAVSYPLSLQPGAVTIILAGAVYLAVLAGARLLRRRSA